MTGVVVVAVALVLGVWDVFAFTYWGSDATVTHTVRGFAQRYPVVVFLLGLLAGHLLP